MVDHIPSRLQDLGSVPSTTQNGKHKGGDGDPEGYRCKNLITKTQDKLEIQSLNSDTQRN